MPSLHGAYTALITPFTHDGDAVDFDRLAEQITYQARPDEGGGVNGVVPCGTTGESPTLTDREHRAVIEKTVEVARPLDLGVIAGAGSNSTSHAVDLHRFAAEAGADGSLQVNPYYNRPSQEGLYRHFMTIADAADLPIVLYNIPGRCAVALSISTIERLAKHPNIVAIKEATGSLDLASEIEERTELTILSGDDTLTLPIAAVGGRGVVSVAGNLVPGRVRALCDAFNRDDWPEARRLHRELFSLCRALLTLDVNPVPLKGAMELLGRDSGALRPPLCQAAEQVRVEIERVLTRSGLRKPAATL